MFEKLFNKADPNDANSFGIIKYHSERLNDDHLISLINELFNSGAFILASDIAKSSNVHSIKTYTRDKLFKEFNIWLQTELIYHSTVAEVPQPKLTKKKKYDFIVFFDSISKFGFSDEMSHNIKDFILKGHPVLTFLIFDANFKALMGSFRISYIQELTLFLFSIKTNLLQEEKKLNSIIHSFLNEIAYTSLIHDFDKDFENHLLVQKNLLIQFNNHDQYSFKNIFLIEIIVNKELNLANFKNQSFIKYWLKQFAHLGIENTELLKFLAKFNYCFPGYDFKNKLIELNCKLNNYIDKSTNFDDVRLNKVKNILKESNLIAEYVIFHLERLNEDDALAELIRFKEKIEVIHSSFQSIVGYKEFNEFIVIEGIKTRKRKTNSSGTSFLVDILNKEIISKGNDLINYLNSLNIERKENLISIKNITKGFLPYQIQNEKLKPVFSLVNIENPNLETFYLDRINYYIFNQGQMFLLSKKNDNLIKAFNALGIKKLFGKLDFWVLNQLIKHGLQTKYSNHFINYMGHYFNFDFDEHNSLKLKGEPFDMFLSKHYSNLFQLLLTEKEHIISWKKINECFDNNIIFTGDIIRRSAGGFIVNVFGIEAFLPGSQIDFKSVLDYDIYIGKSMEFKVVKINHESRNFVISHRALIEANREKKRKEIFSCLEKGQIIKGTVKNIQSFGVFIDLGPIDGMIHITDLSWGRINHSEEIIHLNQKLNVVVLDFDEEMNRISLGLKQLHPNPWDSLSSKLKIGDKVQGKVVDIEVWGAFVEIVSGFEGIIHVSEISWSKNITSAQDFLTIGNRVEAVIIKLDFEEREMSLSIKELMPDPWTDIEAKYEVGSKHSVKARHLADFGVFVELEEGVDGLIHISDLSWKKKLEHPSEFCQKGDDMQVVVLKMDRENKTVLLGHKQLEENSWDIFKATFTDGSIHQGTIIKMKGQRLTGIVSLPYGFEGICPVKHMNKEDGSKAQVNETLEFKVLEYKKESMKIIVSHTRTFEEGEDRPSSTAKSRVTTKKSIAPKKAASSSSHQIVNQIKTTFGAFDVLSGLKKKMEKGEENNEIDNK